MGRSSRKFTLSNKCSFRRRFKRFRCIVLIIIFGILITISFTIYQLSISVPDNQPIQNNIFQPLIIQQNTHTKSTHLTTQKPTQKPTLKPIKFQQHNWFSKPQTVINSKLTTNEPMGKPSQSELHRKPLKPLIKIDHQSWTVNWTLASSVHNLTSDNVSSAVIWKHKNYNGYCGTQLYAILTNANGLEYLWVHDVMSIEVATKVWIFATDPSSVFNRETEPPIWLGLYHSYLICAFNDGTTVISDEIKFMRRKNLDFIVVICDIPLSLREDVLASGFNTSVGVSLFDSRNRSLNIIGGDKVWMNVTIPVCSTFVVNRGKHIYQSDGMKFSHIVNSDDPIKEKKNHFLSACLIIHPSGDKYHEMNTRIIEWIEYGKIMGFQHFYIYDHLHGDRDSSDKFIWDAIYYYIKHGGKVTYVSWPFPYTVPWIFQYSFINSCLNRFKYDNDYISIIDVDEYLIPPKQFITVVDVINHINNIKHKHVNMFVLKCKLATTCQENLGCQTQFNSFLQRHACISDDKPPTNPKKYIINPMAIWYAFVHGIPRWKENVDNVAYVFTEIGICLHARDHHKASTFYHNQSVDHIVDFLNYAWKHPDIKIHPLFDENREFCPR